MKRKLNWLFGGVIAIAITICLGLTACGGDGGGGGGYSESVEVTANNSGEIEIQYGGGEEMTVKITTNLPAPNNSFTLTTTGESKKITDLEPNQKVKVKISFSGNYANIDVYGNVVYIQTYKN